MHSIVATVVTSVTFKLVTSYPVTSVTLLLLLPCYFCYPDTSVTLLLCYPAYYFEFCYLVTSVTLLPCYFLLP